MIGDDYDMYDLRELRREVEENEQLLDRLDTMSDEELDAIFEDHNRKLIASCLVQEIKALNFLIEELEWEEEDEKRNHTEYGLDPAFGSWREVNSMFV